MPGLADSIRRWCGIRRDVGFRETWSPRRSRVLCRCHRPRGDEIAPPLRRSVPCKPVVIDDGEGRRQVGLHPQGGGTQYLLGPPAGCWPSKEGSGLPAKRGQGRPSIRSCIRNSRGLPRFGPTAWRADCPRNRVMDRHLDGESARSHDPWGSTSDGPPDLDSGRPSWVAVGNQSSYRLATGERESGGGPDGSAPDEALEVYRPGDKVAWRHGSILSTAACRIILQAVSTATTSSTGPTRRCEAVRILIAGCFTLPIVRVRQSGTLPGGPSRDTGALAPLRKPKPDSDTVRVVARCLDRRLDGRIRDGPRRSSEAEWTQELWAPWRRSGSRVIVDEKSVPPRSGGI